MPETRLSQQQLNYFNTFGYLYFPRPHGRLH